MQIEQIKVLTSKARSNLEKAADYRRKADSPESDSANSAEIFRSFAHTLEKDAEDLANIALELSK